MPPKKIVFNPFVTHARARSIEPPDQLCDDDVGPGEFRDSAVTFSPAAQKCETIITLQFRCTVKIVRGDTVVFRLAGFKGAVPTVFTLESRPHPENKDFHDYFHAYWAGESAIKGGPPAQSITLQCRKAIEQNALVIVGVPDSVHITVPDKLAANSTKLKIEGVVKHSAGGKIPKAPVMSCTEVKKRPLDEDIAELTSVVEGLVRASGLDETDLRLASEITVPEVDQIWEASRQRSELKFGLSFRLESSVFRQYEEHAPLAKLVTDSYLAASKQRIPLAIHKELAANLDVKTSAIVVLEDCLYTLHGCHFPELSRSAVMVLRLYTCEAHDIAHMLGLVQSICIYRELGSAVRTHNAQVMARWANFVGILTTCCSKLTHIAPEMIPSLYRGVKDLPPDDIQSLLSLKKDDWYLFPNFTQYVTENPLEDESFTAPDSAVLFEVQGAVDGIELGDIGQYPEDREWLLPMFSSFSVVSVEVLPEMNNLTRVVLRMRGSLAGALRDEMFPEEHRSLSSVVIKKAKTEAMMTGEQTQLLCKMIFQNLKLQVLKCQHPTYLQHSQYLEKYADTKRLSVARQRVDEGLVRWQQCTNEAVVNTDGTLRPATWENVPKKQAVFFESSFLKCTRTNKVFTADSTTLDFNENSCDFGKGSRRMRRMIGKHQSYPFQS